MVRDPKMPAGAELWSLCDAAFSATLKSAIDCCRRLMLRFSARMMAASSSGGIFGLRVLGERISFPATRS
jgi:hypothetical protein